MPIKKDIICDTKGVGYFNHTLVKGSSIRGSYFVKDGTELIMGVAFRKQEQLSTLILPKGLLYIGDATFSLCKSLKQITIPASVDHIGAVSFCDSGLQEITFEGKPGEIDSTIFRACKNLKKIIVPKGTKGYFANILKDDADKIVEAYSGTTSSTTYQPKAGKVVVTHDLFGAKEVSVEEGNLFAQQSQQTQPVKPKVQRDIFGQAVVKRSHLVYNLHEFNWAVGDEVKLSDLFSGYVNLGADPSYQFRRRAIFVFMKTATASQLDTTKKYEIPTFASFQSNYQKKYGNWHPRIFVFTCDDKYTAKFYDEVKFRQKENHKITVESVLR